MFVPKLLSHSFIPLIFLTMPAIITVRNHRTLPYPSTTFDRHTAATKSRKARQLVDYASSLTNAPISLFLHVINSTSFGKQLSSFQNCNFNGGVNFNIIDKILSMHKAAMPYQKATTLALVSQHYNIRQLYNLGFCFSQTQNTRSRALARSNN